MLVTTQTNLQCISSYSSSELAKKLSNWTKEEKDIGKIFFHNLSFSRDVSLNQATFMYGDSLKSLIRESGVILGIYADFFLHSPFSWAKPMCGVCPLFRVLRVPLSRVIYTLKYFQMDKHL